MRGINDMLKHIQGALFTAQEIDIIVKMLIARHDGKEPLKVTYQNEK